MEYIAYKITSDQQAMLDKIISGVLPHENFDSDVASDVLSDLFDTLRENEVYGVYYVIFHIFKNIKAVHLYRKSFGTILNRNVFESSVATSVQELIKREEFGANLYFRDYGKTYNLEIQAELNDAVDFCYTELMNKYDELFEMAVPTGESLAHIEVLKEDMKITMSQIATTIQGQILTTGYQYKYSTLRGYSDWLSFTDGCMRELSVRFSDKLSARYTPSVISSYDDSLRFNEENKMEIRPLYYMGWEPIDNITCINTGDILTIVATEGVGKTRLVIDQVLKALLAGVNCMVICGETNKAEMKYNIESAVICHFTGMQLKFTEIADPTKIAHDTEEELEDIILTINTTLSAFYENDLYGTIQYEQSMKYEHFDEDIRKLKEKNPFDIVFVDHVAALDSTGEITSEGRLTTTNSKLNYLYKAEDVLTKDLGLAFVNTNHTSNDAEDKLSRGKEVGTRIGGNSSATSKWSGIMVLLQQTSDLKRNDCVMLTAKKIRRENTPEYPIILRRSGYGNIHTYDPELQYQVKGSAEDIDFENEEVF